jgi:hypothetical protein
MAFQPHDPRLFRLLLRHLAVGVAAGFVIAALIYALDIGGLRSLAHSSRDGALAMGILTFGLVFLFGPLAMGAGVMLHDFSKDK